MSDIEVVSVSNVWNEYKMKFLFESSKKNNFNVNILGLGKKFTWLERMKWLLEYIENSNKLIVCFTDAYDVFYIDNLDVIKNKFLNFNCDIVWSVENWYSHQLKEDKCFFDNICQVNTRYKYLNGGTFIGYREKLKKLLNDIINISLKDSKFINELNINFYNDNIPGLDQTWISHHLVKNWEKYNIKFDYLCEIFYVPSEDWYNIEKYIDTSLTLLSTGKKPSIFHVTWKAKFEHILRRLYNWKYNPMIYDFLYHKEYNWYNNTIQFLENGKMNAFGDGTYEYINKNLIKAFFGEKEHIISFNEDYTEYTSVRTYDNEIVKGCSK